MCKIASIALVLLLAGCASPRAALEAISDPTPAPDASVAPEFTSPAESPSRPSSTPGPAPRRQSTEPATTPSPETGTFSGMVRDHNGDPLFNAYVYAVPEGAAPSRTDHLVATSGPHYAPEHTSFGTGEYQSRRLAPGRYRILFSEQAHQDEWFDDAATMNGARWITITSGADLAGIDATLELPPPPANDHIADAARVSAFPFSDLRDTRGATVEAGEPQRCDTAHKTVWYRLTVDSTMKVGIETRGSNYDTLVTVFAGEPKNESMVTCGTYQQTQGTMTFDALPATTYWIQIGDVGTLGGTELRVSITAA